MDEPENQNAESEEVKEKEEDVSADAQSSGADASRTEEGKPEAAKTDKGTRKREKALLAAMGENVGRAVRVLGEGSRVLFKGSGGVVVRTARGVGTGVGKLDAKRRELAAGGELKERCDNIRRQLDETRRKIGVESAQSAAADGSSITVGDGLQKLLAREKSLREELGAAEKAVQERAEAAAAKKAAKVKATEPGAEAAITSKDEEEVEQVEPKKKGRAKRAARAKTEEASAQDEQEPTAESAAEAEAEGETGR